MNAEGTAGRPLIGLPACHQLIKDMDYHVIGDKYLRAAAIAAGGVPVVLPALGATTAAADLLARLDGMIITGSPSNVEPHHYDGPDSAPETRHDPARDATTLPLIRMALDMGVPTLAICRGFQELNVALGGSLHQRIEEIPGKLNHQAEPSLPLEQRYGPAHGVRLAPEGQLARIAAGLAQPAGEMQVNSLHSQGVDRLAPGLAVEATAPDGIIEAARVVDAPAFALGVQWHPEWQVDRNPFSQAIFGAFGAAARGRAASGAASAGRTQIGKAPNSANFAHG
ncbi:MAG: gamma-glutamyl-gamma-aminobutyrate hydrolase family protein [Alphaproteobacteria bacterium]|nr:gamma-glutamyl-gamma-aminobutyrate hydrolase family protein [Alphaproteobacteria bacterium]